MTIKGDCELVTIGIHLEKVGYFNNQPCLRVGWITTTILLLISQMIFALGIFSEGLNKLMIITKTDVDYKNVQIYQEEELSVCNSKRLMIMVAAMVVTFFTC